MVQKKLLPPDAALKEILHALPQMGSESVPIGRSRGRILCEEIIANEDIPRHANSSMDGYAVLDRSTGSASADGPITFRIVGESSAGSPFAEDWNSASECVRIMTGAVVPDGANAVVELELVTEQNEMITVTGPVPRGRNIRLPGEDVRHGESAIPAGVTIEPEHIGVMATLGYTEVGVALKPSTTIITTGSELVDPDAIPEPGKIRNASLYMISSYVEQAGGNVVSALTVKDEKAALVSALESSWESDVVITTGGVSVGKYDMIPDVLQQVGVDLKFRGVNIKPGKPLAFGTAPNGTPVFCLPGNPVSSAVTFRRFILPAYDSMMRRVARSHTHCKARLEEDIDKKDTKVHYLRGIFSLGEDMPTVRRTGTQSSGALSSLVKANCLIHLPAEKRTFSEGEIVEIQIL